MSSPEHVSINHPVFAIDADDITIQGADVLFPPRKNRPIHTNDYLGVGTPSWKL